MSLTVPKAGSTAGRAADITVTAPETGNAVAELGAKVQHLGNRLEADRLDRQRARLQVDLTRDFGQLRLQADQIGDPEQIDSFWAGGVSDLRKNYLEGLADNGRPLVDPANRDRFGLMFDSLNNGHALDIARRAMKLRASQRSTLRRSVIDETISASAQAGTAATDNMVARASDTIAGDLQKGAIDAETARRDLADLTAGVAVETAPSIRIAIRDIENKKSDLPKESVARAVSRANELLQLRNAGRRSAEKQAHQAVQDIKVNVLTPEPVSLPPVPDFATQTQRLGLAKQRAAQIATDMQEMTLPERADVVSARLDSLGDISPAKTVLDGLDTLTRLKALAASGALVDDPLLSISQVSDPVPVSTTEADLAPGWHKSIGKLIDRAFSIKDGAVAAMQAAQQNIAEKAQSLIDQGLKSVPVGSIDQAQEHQALTIVSDELQSIQEKPAVDVARMAGIDLPPIVSDIGALSGWIVDRASRLGEFIRKTGLSDAAITDPSEAMQIAGSLASATPVERAHFLRGISGLDMQARLSLAKMVRRDDPAAGAAILAADHDPALAAKITSAPPVGAAPENDLQDLSTPPDAISDLAGRDGADYAAALRQAGVADANRLAVEKLAPEHVRQALQSVDDKSSDEALSDMYDLGLSPTQIETLQVVADERPNSQKDAVEIVQARLAQDRFASDLAAASGYTPSDPQAVQDFQSELSVLDKLPDDQKSVHIDAIRVRRQSQLRHMMPRPLFYGGGEMSIDGLREAARRLVEMHRAGSISDKVYTAQAALVRTLVGSFSEKTPLSMQDVQLSAAPDTQQDAASAAAVPEDVSIVASILAQKRARAEAGAPDFLESFSGLPPAEPAVANSGFSAVATAKDVGRGLTEAPKQIFGGVRDAYHAVLTGVSVFDQWASEALDLPKLQVINPDTGEIDIALLSASQAGQAKVILPEVGGAETVTGGLIRGVSQFLAGFVGGSKALGVLGKASTVGGGVARTVGASAISDFAAFDAHEARLSDLIQSNPALANPVTEYLASNQSDSELEGRLKNVAEGLLSDAAVASLVTTLRAVRSARRIKKLAGADTYAKAQERLAKDPKIIDRLAAVEDPALQRLDVPLVARADDAALEAETRAYLDGIRKKVPEIAGDISAEDAARALALGKVQSGSGDVFINWSRIDTIDDVKSVIQQMADVAKKDIDAGRRGVRTNAQTIDAAGQENAWKILAERRVGEPLNAEKSLALRQLWAASGEQLMAAAKLVQSAPTDANIFAFRRAMALHGTIQGQVTAARTETARALQQWAIPAGGNSIVAKQIEETVKAFGGSDVASDIARKITALAQDGDLAAIDALSRKSARVATLDAIYEYWVSSLLSGPKTHMVNATSNTSVLGLIPTERVAAAAIGSLRGSKGGVARSEAGAWIYGAVSSLPEAFRVAGKALRTGDSGFGVRKFQISRTRAISSEALASTSNRTFNQIMNTPVISHGVDILGAVVSAPGRALAASDDFFKTINYRAELHALSARQAASEIGDGALKFSDVKKRMAEIVSDPSQEMELQAREAAQVNTFTNDPGAFAGIISGLKAKVPFARYLVPFINTPANILRFAAERSPAAPLLKDVRADIAAGGARADLALARMGLGSIAMTTAYDMAMSDKITGGGPSNPNARAALLRSGWKPYSIRSGDRYVAYNRLDPFGLLFGVAADLAEMTKNAGEDPGSQYDEIVYRTIGSVGGNMMDKTYMRGLSEFFTAMSDPGRYAPRYFEHFAASFVPRLSAEIARAQDPKLHRITNTVDALKANLPGLSREVPVRHDLWGREISYQSGLGAAYDALSPIYTSRYDPQPIDEELPRIDYFPGLPQRKITINNIPFRLNNSPKIYEEYVVLQGATPASRLPRANDAGQKPTKADQRLNSYGDKTLREVLNAIVSGEFGELSAQYADADQIHKRNLIKRTISDYRRAAKKALIAKHPDFFSITGAVSK